MTRLLRDACSLLLVKLLLLLLVLLVEVCKSDVSNQNDNGFAHTHTQSARHAKIQRLTSLPQFQLYSLNVSCLSSVCEKMARGKEKSAAIKIVICLNGASHLRIPKTIVAVVACVRAATVCE
jgi:hypothetical protein